MRGPTCEPTQCRAMKPSHNANGATLFFWHSITHYKVWLYFQLVEASAYQRDAPCLGEEFLLHLPGQMGTCHAPFAMRPRFGVTQSIAE